MFMDILGIIMSIVMSILGFFMIFMISFVIYIQIAGQFLSLKHERNYKCALISLFKKNCKDNLYEYIRSIDNEYTTYKDSSIFFSYKQKIVLNSTLVSELRTGEYKKYAKESISNSEDIASLIEKANHLMKSDDSIDKRIEDKLKELSKSSLDANLMEQMINDIRLEILSLISFNEGRLYEKNIKINDLEKEKRRILSKKGFSYIIGFIGIIGSVITIISYFSK